MVKSRWSSGRSSARQECTVRVREVAGSNPAAPTDANHNHHECRFIVTMMDHVEFQRIFLLLSSSKFCKIGKSPGSKGAFFYIHIVEQIPDGTAILTANLIYKIWCLLSFWHKPLICNVLLRNRVIRQDAGIGAIFGMVLSLVKGFKNML